MEVRHPRSDEELRAIVRVNRRAWSEAYDDVLPESVLADVAEGPSEEELESRLDSMRADRDRLLVAVEDGVVGYANVRWDDEETKDFVGPDEAGLKEIYVDPDHWSEGVGTALLSAALDLVPDDATALRLEMLEGNDVGRWFYEARGFERTGSDEFEVDGEPCATVVYTLEL